MDKNILNEKISFETFNGQKWIIPVRTFGKFLSLNPARQFSRTIIDGNYDLALDNKTLVISDYKEKNNLKVNQSLQTVDFELFENYQELNARKNKPIWLISDQIDNADDNGRAFFKYVVENHPEIDAYFVLSRSSKDFQEIAKIGKVIDYNSPERLLLALNADLIISSAAEDFVIKFLPKHMNDFYMLFKGKFVFLPHGVSLGNDLRVWLHKNSKNISAFLLSSHREFELFGKSILSDFNYEDNVWKVAGFPRHDLLLKNGTKKEKIILFTPSWRKGIVNEFNRVTGRREYANKFKDSNYFKITNNFLSSKKLTRTLRKKGYKIKFAIHPSIIQQKKDYVFNDVVEFTDDKYSNLLMKGAAIVTDFSSVSYDFAYLKKPVFYLDIDNVVSTKDHSTDNYDWNIRRPFGDIYETVDALVDELVDMIEHDKLEMKTKYEQIVDDIFEYHDTNNSKRVFEMIQKL